MKRISLSEREMEAFGEYLVAEERSRATVEKYLRDVRAFALYVGGRSVTKALCLEYKAYLGEKYAVASANSMLAAVNAFLKFYGRQDLTVKQFKVQRSVCRPEERELTAAEYERLLAAARKRGEQRLFLLLETVSSTGIRVSELKYVTVEGAKRGTVYVNCKGKSRPVIFPRKLCERLLRYAESRGLTAGSIFVTRSGKPLCRTNIWREMKRLCEAAGVDRSKVFPHNLRHLFAVAFYKVKKDIAKLADVMGHSSIETTRLYIRESYKQHLRYMERVRLLL